MHEFNICLDILNILEAQAEQHQIHHIKTLTLAVGNLAGIEIDALKFSFPIAAAKSIAKDCDLVIIPVEGRAHCSHCVDEIVIKSLWDACPDCGNYDYEVTQGKELKIRNMEVG
jgi:hydrogenase nickel incorporation protein HypA/HybF